MIKIIKIVIKYFIFLTIFVTTLFFTIQCNIPSVNNKSDDDKKIDNTKAIIVTVDGLSFANTLLGGPSGLENIQNTNNYLNTNLTKLINSESIRSFTWSGDAGDTAAILQSSNTGLRKFLIDNYNEAKSKNKAFIVVGHSWGTFLSYLALSLEIQIQCDLFITLSSPLGTASGLPASPEKIIRDYTDARLLEMTFDISGPKYPNAKVFYNFWANGDLISGPLTGKIPAVLNVQDVRVDQAIADQRDLTGCYFWHNFTNLGDEVIKDATFLPYLAYLVTLGINDINPTRNTFISQVVSQVQSASGY